MKFFVYIGRRYTLCRCTAAITWLSIKWSDCLPRILSAESPLYRSEKLQAPYPLFCTHISPPLLHFYTTLSLLFNPTTISIISQVSSRAQHPSIFRPIMKTRSTGGNCSSGVTEYSASWTGSVSNNNIISDIAVIEF